MVVGSILIPSHTNYSLHMLVAFIRIDMHHTKTHLKIFVVVISKEGLMGRALQFFFWYGTKYSECDTQGWTGPSQPNLLLV